MRELGWDSEDGKKDFVVPHCGSSEGFGSEPDIAFLVADAISSLPPEQAGEK